MSQPTPPVDFLHALASGILKEEDPDRAGVRAAEVLREVLREQKSFVVDVQFTGFTSRGKPVGNVDPRLLRVTSQLIMNRVSRIGFTAHAGAAELAALLRVVATPPGELGTAGIVGALQQAAVRGVYLTTATGETYRPPAAAPPPAPTTPTTDAPASAGMDGAPSSDDPASPTAEAPRQEIDALGFEPLEVSFSNFEILEAFPAVAPEPGDTARPGSAAAAGPPEAEATQPGAGDLFHFFRAAGGRNEPEPATIPRMLRAAESVNHFDEAAQAATRAAQRLTAAGEHGPAIAILEALVSEAQRPDRSRLFREAAESALRRMSGDGTLHALVDRLQHAGGAERERIVRVAVFVGGDAPALLEGMLFRTGDEELRHQLLSVLFTVEGMPARLRSRAMDDPAPARTRALLDAAVAGAIPHEAAQQWVIDAATQADSSVRADAARHAGTVGGRGGLRVLVDLLHDADRNVKRAALEGIGALGDAAAVPFLARALNDAADEDVQLAAIGALGRLGSAEAVPTLLNLINRRQLFSGKKLVRVKVAALAALGRIPTPAAREVLTSVAGGKDSDLALEARRILSLLDPS